MYHRRKYQRRQSGENGIKRQRGSASSAKIIVENGNESA
jgi:hypothetical protein